MFKIKALESILCSIIRYAPDILELLAYLFYAVNIFLNTFISSIEIVANRIVALTIFFAFNNMFSKLYSMFFKNEEINELKIEVSKLKKEISNLKEKGKSS